MNLYSDSLEKILNLPKSKGVKASLSNIERLVEIYNHPERAFRTVHVAGTNGKGSVCTKIAATLREEGYLVGLYTSPHIASFRERIQVDGKMIREEELTILFSDVQKAIAHFFIPATFFEIATLLAFLYFRYTNVDLAVIETGIGGRWDATNVILPLASIITSIGFDHTEILGRSLEEIAREKAGIIKPGVPVVVGPDVPLSFFEKAALEKNAPLFQSLKRSYDYDWENQEIAKAALTLLGSSFPFSPTSMEKGLLARPPCRFERHLVQGKEVVLDVAHNSHAFRRLIEKLKEEFPHHRYRFLVGFSKGKDILECARAIQEVSSEVHLMASSHTRLASLEEMKPFFTAPHGTLYLEGSIPSAVQNALAAPCEGEVLVVSGSFFLMADARRALGLKDPDEVSFWSHPDECFSA